MIQKMIMPLVVGLGATTLVYGQVEEKKIAKSPRIETQGPWGMISYGQPSKNNRNIFGELVPYGKVWRLGANMSTDIIFKSDVKFGGTLVKAGTYSLFAIPEEGKWTLILNSVPAQRGASQFEENRQNIVAEVSAPVQNTQQVVEKLTMTPNEKDLTIEWDNVKVVVPVEFI